MIKEVIANQIQAEKQEENGVKVYPTEEVLGSMKPIKDFAAFYVTHKTELQIIKAHYLLQYCEGLSFTPDQLSAYKMGLDAFMKFFESSEADVKSYLLQAETANKKSVG